MYLLLIRGIFSLSYVCNYYDLFGDVGGSNYLYKEDNVDEVKWLEKYEYCRAKGDRTVYFDAGQGKCEYSRGICYWNGDSCLETYRDNDLRSECESLYNNNRLVEGLDNGRLQGSGDTPQEVVTEVVESQEVTEVVESQENPSCESPDQQDSSIFIDGPSFFDEEENSSSVEENGPLFGNSNFSILSNSQYSNSPLYFLRLLFR